MARRLLEGITGHLHVEVSEPPEQITERLLNRKATPSSIVKSVKLEAAIAEHDDLRDLTADELSAVAFAEREITLRGLGAAVHHAAPNGVRFTVRDLLAAVEETERRTRPQTEWFGGVDEHHVFFQGAYWAADGVWEISWGS